MDEPKKDLFLSLTPNFSWVNHAPAAFQPFQRFPLTLAHNEQAKCYRTWQGRITFWDRRKLRPAILWSSLLLVSGCSRTGSIEVTWKNCCLTAKEA